MSICFGQYVFKNYLTIFQEDIFYRNILATKNVAAAPIAGESGINLPNMVAVPMGRT